MLQPDITTGIILGILFISILIVEPFLTISQEELVYKESIDNWDSYSNKIKKQTKDYHWCYIFGWTSGFISLFLLIPVCDIFINYLPKTHTHQSFVISVFLISLNLLIILGFFIINCVGIIKEVYVEIKRKPIDFSIELDKTIQEAIDLQHHCKNKIKENFLLLGTIKKIDEYLTILNDIRISKTCNKQNTKQLKEILEHLDTIKKMSNFKITIKINTKDWENQLEKVVDNVIDGNDIFDDYDF